MPTRKEFGMTGALSSSEGRSRLLDIDEVAELFGLSRDAIYARRSRGEFPPAIHVGNVLRWRARDIEDWLDDRREAQR